MTIWTCCINKIERKGVRQSKIRARGISVRPAFEHLRWNISRPSVDKISSRCLAKSLDVFFGPRWRFLVYHSALDGQDIVSERGTSKPIPSNQRQEHRSGKYNK